MTSKKIKDFFKGLKEKLRKGEYSKLVCTLISLVIGIIAIYAILKYYALAELAIETGSSVLPDATLAVTCVSVLLGAFLSYCLYQFGLKNSRNKYGVDCNGQPYREKIVEYLSEAQPDTESEDNLS